MSHNHRRGWWERLPCTPWSIWTPWCCAGPVFRRPRAWFPCRSGHWSPLSRLPSLLITLPRYLKSSTIFSWVPSIEMMGRWAAAAGAGWNRTSVLLRLMVRPKKWEASANLLTMIWKTDSLCAMRAQSSANSTSRTVFYTVFVLAVSRQRSNREPSSRYRRYTPCSRSMMAWSSTQVKNRLKRTGASTHPCLTPLEMLKGSDASPSESTCPVMSSWNWRIRFTNLVGHPRLDRIIQRASLLTVSKAFVRSMKTATRSISCSMHRREMPRWLPQSVLLPLFLNREMKMAFLNSLGTSSYSQMLVRSEWSASSATRQADLKISEDLSSCILRSAAWACLWRCLQRSCFEVEEMSFCH